MGKTFGQYEILDKLGQGGMGTVYRARQLGLDRLVALKLLNIAGATSRRKRQRFLAEAKVTARLQHPNIVTVLDVGEDRGQLFLAMELLDGQPLDAIIGQGLPALRRSVQWMAQICDAVGHAHERELIHRDLKPQNIMIDSQQKPVVMDFGIAKDTAAEVNLTRTGAWVGTPNYMSPEQAEGRRDIDARTDIFALGGLLFSLLTGKPPFVGDSPSAVVMAVIEQDPVRPSSLNPEVPPELDLICLKCMRRDRHERYPSAGALASDLRAFLENRPIGARPESVSQKVRRLTLRHRVIIASAAAAMIVVTVAVFWVASPCAVEAPPEPPLAAVPEAPAPSSVPPRSASPVPDAELLREPAKAASDGQGHSATDRARLDDALMKRLREVDDLVVRGQYDEAVTACDALLGGQMPDALRTEVVKRKSWAEQLAGAGGPPARPPATVSDGDRMLAKGDFAGAESAYRSANADPVRQQWPTQLAALRSDAAGVMSSGTQPSVAPEGKVSAVLCAMDSGGVVLADSTGRVQRRKWPDMQSRLVYDVYAACLKDPSPAQHAGLGTLCGLLGLSAQAQDHFAAAARGGDKALVDRVKACRNAFGLADEP